MSTCCSCGSQSPCAAKIAIFRHLDEDSLWKISAIALHRTYKKGNILFTPEENKGLFLLSEGKVKVYEISCSGKEQLLRVLNKGDFAGENALFSDRKSYTYGEAITDVEACFIRREDFMDLLLRYPSISIKLLEEFSRRMAMADHHTTANTSEAVMGRLIAYLQELSEAQDSRTVQLPMNMKELAAFLSTAPETLSRRMKALEAQGKIQRKGRTITLMESMNPR